MTGTEIITLDPSQLPKLLSDDGLMAETIATFTDAALAEAPDTSTAAGRQNIKSLAYKATLTKAPLRDKGRELKEDAQKTIKDINTRLKKWDDAMDGLATEIKKPLVSWTEKDDARKEAHQANLDAIVDMQAAKGSDAIQRQIDALKTKEIIKDAWQEYFSDAEVAKDHTIRRLLAAKVTAVAAEKAEEQRLAQEKELAALRAEKKRLEEESAEKETKRLADEVKAKEEREAKEAKERQAREDEEAEKQKERDVETAAAKKREDEIAAKLKEQEEENQRLKDENEQRELEAERLAKKEKEQQGAEGASEAVGDGEGQVDTPATTPATPTASAKLEPWAAAKLSFVTFGFSEEMAETILQHINHNRIPFVFFDPDREG